MPMKKSPDKIPYSVLSLFLQFFRNTEDEDLITQLDVFDEGLSVDQEVIEGMDISNHKDVFRAVYSKVRLLLID